MSETVKGIACWGMGLTLVALVIYGAILGGQHERQQKEDDFARVCTKLRAEFVTTEDDWMCIRNGEVVY